MTDSDSPIMSTKEIRGALCKTKSKGDLYNIVCLIKWLEQTKERIMLKQTNSTDEDCVVIIY